MHFNLFYLIFFSFLFLTNGKNQCKKETISQAQGENPP